MSRDALLRAASYIVSFSLFLWSILSKGTPAVRHDWIWPLDTAGLLQRLSDLGSGWFSEGFGHPNAYPMTYLVSLALVPIAVIFGSKATLVLLLSLVAAAAFLAAEAIGRRFRLGSLATSALAVFLLFEPWMYNKMVAGHLTQTLSSFGLVVVLTELTVARLRPYRLALALIITGLQLQLFIVAAGLTVLRCRDRSALGALSIAVFVFSPTLIGLVLDRKWLSALPFAIPWEIEQSVPLRSGVRLGGYFAHYADGAFSGVGKWALLTLAAMAWISPLVVRSRPAIALALLAAGTLVFASGTTWWLAYFWRWAIVKPTGIGIFREIYDLIAVVAAAYAVLIGALLGRIRWLKWPALVAAMALAFMWARVPPADAWVGAESLQRIPVLDTAGSSRFALMPPFQPESYRGVGSGADPLYAGRWPGQYPANALLPVFPENRALWEFWTRGGRSSLERLGIGVVLCRPGFASAPGSFFSGDRGNPQASCTRSRVIRLRPAPFAALEDRVALCSLCANAGAGDVFVGDRFPKDFIELPSERSAVAPADGWVDARLISAFDPNLAQGLGGSYTTQHSLPLSVPKSPYALVAVTGSLIDENRRVVAKDTKGYRWVPLVSQKPTLTCEGACLVAGVGDPSSVPLEGSQSALLPLRADEFSPWLYIVDIPERHSGLLRLLTSYDGGWTGFTLDEGRRLKHIRIDTAFNGWLVPQSATNRRIWLVHIPSLLQAVAEVIGFWCTILVLVLELQAAGKRVDLRQPNLAAASMDR